MNEAAAIMVSAADDPRLAPYRAIRERDLIRDEGLFIAEGKFILGKLLSASRFPAVSILALERHKDAVEALREQAGRAVPIYLAPDTVLNAIAGFDVHRGILAAGNARGATPMTAADLIATSRRIALLCGLSNAENVGAIFRNAAGLGIDAILLDRQCIHPLSRRALRVSMGSALTLPWAVDDGGMLVTALIAAGFTTYALSPGARQTLDTVRFAERSAVVFGEEAHGLPTALMARLEGVSIPMAGGIDSLNVAASSAIVFDALRRSQARA